MTNREEIPPQGWWNNQIERRINEMHVSLERAWQELRDEIKRGDNKQFILNTMDERIREIRKQMDDLRENVRDDLLTKEDFEPYRKGIILVLSAIVLAVITAVLRLVIVST